MVELDDLVRFLEHPVRGFLRQRLDVLVAEEGDELDEALAIELDGLQSWAIGDRWLSARLAGAEADACEQAEWRRGFLPPGALGRRALVKIQQQAEPLVAVVAPLRTGAPVSHDVVVPLPDGSRFTGTVSGIHGHRVVRAVYSRLAPKHRLRAWAQLLALAAGRPDQQWQAVTLGRGRGGVSRSTLGGISAHEATAVLGELVDLYRRGMTEPLPLPLQTSAAYAGVRLSGDTELVARDAARRRWSGDFAEADDRYHARVWGNGSALEVLLTDPPGDDEQPDGGHERHRFGALACRLWWPLLRAETVDSP